MVARATRALARSGCGWPRPPLSTLAMQHPAPGVVVVPADWLRCRGGASSCLSGTASRLAGRWVWYAVGLRRHYGGLDCADGQPRTTTVRQQGPGSERTLPPRFSILSRPSARSADAILSFPMDRSRCSLLSCVTARSFAMSTRAHFLQLQHSHKQMSHSFSTNFKSLNS